MQEIIIDARTDSPLVTSSTIPANKTQTGEPVTVERVFPLPNVEDGMTAEDFGVSIGEWLEELRLLQANKAVLTILDEDGEPVWKEVAPDGENGLIDPFLRKPITFATVVEYLRRALSVDHNRVMRELAMEKAGIQTPKEKKEVGKKLPSRRI